MYETLARAFTALDVGQVVALQEAITIAPSMLSIKLSQAVNDYDDVCILFDGEVPTGWITLRKLHEKIEEHISDDVKIPVAEMVSSLTPDMIVASSTSLHDLVPLLAFMPQKRRFITTVDKITHTILYEDLECQPYRICVLSLALDLEQQTRHLISGSEMRTELLMNLSNGDINLASSRFNDAYGHQPDLSGLHNIDADRHPIPDRIPSHLDEMTVVREFVAYGPILQFAESEGSLADLLPEPGISLLKKAASLRNALVHDQPLLARFDKPSELQTLIFEMADLARELEIMNRT